MKFQMPVQHIPRVRIIKSPRFNYSEIEAGVNKLSGYGEIFLRGNTEDERPAMSLFR